MMTAMYHALQLLKTGGESTSVSFFSFSSIRFMAYWLDEGRADWQTVYMLQGHQLAIL